MVEWVTRTTTSPGSSRSREKSVNPASVLPSRSRMRNALNVSMAGTLYARGAPLANRRCCVTGCACDTPYTSAGPGPGRQTALRLCRFRPLGEVMVGHRAQHRRERGVQRAGAEVDEDPGRVRQALGSMDAGQEREGDRKRPDQQTDDQHLES